MTLRERECRECGESKPLIRFRRRTAGSETRRFICRACEKARERRKRGCRTVEQVRADADARQRALAEAVLQRKRERLAAINPRRAHDYDMARRFTTKVQANRALQRAVARGEVVKPSSCQACGKSLPLREIHGHHADYSKPFDVAWLCCACHVSAHGGAWAGATRKAKAW